MTKFGHMSRRSAVKGIAIASTAPSLFAKGANEKVVMGAIGLGGRGRAHAKLLAARKDVGLAFVCDADLKRAEQAAD